jgi:YegS/Rv2252/BmrU family lipid kinase
MPVGMYMNKRSAVLITNPTSGGGGSRRARTVERFCALMNERGVDVDVRPTKGPEDATRLAAEANREGCREIIVSGGDGTINEAVQALAGTDVRMAIWPTGTANVLGRELGMTANLERTAELIADGPTRRMHIGCATSEASGAKRYFFLMAGIGLDASIVKRVIPALKKRVGKAAFWYSGLEHLAFWKPKPFTLEVDGQVFPATFAAVGNSPHYGGNLSVTPGARLGKAEFEICVINSRNRLKFLQMLPYAVSGVSTKNVAGITHLRTTTARADGDGVLVQADGELIGELPMTFEVAPFAINVVSRKKL